MLEKKKKKGVREGGVAKGNSINFPPSKEISEMCKNTPVYF